LRRLGAFSVCTSDKRRRSVSELSSRFMIAERRLEHVLADGNCAHKEMQKANAEDLQAKSNVSDASQ